MKNPTVSPDKNPIILYLFHWKEFLETTWKHIPSLTIYVATYALGVVTVFNKIEANLLAGKDYAFSSWGEVLVASLLVGSIVGFLGYWFNGYIIQLGIFFSGGKSQGPLTRKLIIITQLPHMITGALFILVKVLFFQTFSQRIASYATLISIEALLNVILAFYSLYLLLSGIVHLFGTSWKRTLLVFIGGPLILTLMLWVLFTTLHTPW